MQHRQPHGTRNLPRRMRVRSVSRALHVRLSAAEQAWREERVATHRVGISRRPTPRSRRAPCRSRRSCPDRYKMRCAGGAYCVVGEGITVCADAVPIADNAAKEAISVEAGGERERRWRRMGRAHAAGRSSSLVGWSGHALRRRRERRSANAVQKAAEESRADLALERGIGGT